MTAVKIHKILVQCEKYITLPPERIVELTNNLIDRVCEYEDCCRAQVALTFLGEYPRDFNLWKPALIGNGVNFDRLSAWNDARFDNGYLITDKKALGKKFKKHGGKVHLIR